MAATVVHEAWVDCITVVAIASITPLADTLALQEGDISVLQTYQCPQLLPKKSLRQQNLFVIYFPKFSSWSFKTWKCRDISLAGHHPLTQHRGWLITQVH